MPRTNGDVGSDEGSASSERIVKALEKNGATKSDMRARMGMGGDAADAWTAVVR